MDYSTLYRKTKIICTLGPASDSVEKLVALIGAGMDAARLNFSHGTHEEHLESIDNIREASKRTGKPLAIIQDLQGPKIRTGKLSTPSVELKKGELLVITTEEILGDEKKVSTTYKDLSKDVKSGDRILVDDGLMELKVLNVKPPEVFCKVVTGGTLKDHKGLNLPGVSVSAPSLTEKDLEDLKFGLENDVDYVALSFVRSPKDLQDLRDAMEKIGKHASIIAKIEKGEAIQNIEGVIAPSDAVMVARGDLGVELPTEDVPVLQKKIIQHCNFHGKPVIIATQMLESMIKNPRPTRAEASDVANAVLDGADAVMLSGETSVGGYPVEAVTIMDKIIKKAELEGVINYDVPDIQQEEKQLADNVFFAIARAACVLAEQVKAAAIVPVTHSGWSARNLAKYRPRAKILAVTDRDRIIRRLNIVWGVRGILLNKLSDTDTTVEMVQEEVAKSGLVQKGDYIVLTAGTPLLQRGTTNTVRVEKLQ